MSLKFSGFSLISAETSLFFLPFARRSTQKNRTYFLSYRDAAKVCDGLSHQEAHTITLALAQLDVIEIVRKGQPGLNSREAAEFRYLLSDGKNGADEDDRRFELLGDHLSRARAP